MTRFNSLRTPVRRNNPFVPSRGAHSWVGSFWDQLRARRQLRRALRQIQHAPEEVLRDASWSRADLLREIAKPIWRA